MGASSGINASVNAGLPNITGSMRYIAAPRLGYYAITGYAANTKGCFSSEALPNDVLFLPQGSLNKDFTPLDTTFAANRSNSIYGASTTVQPPALKVAVLIKHD